MKLAICEHRDQRDHGRGYCANCYMKRWKRGDFGNPPSRAQYRKMVLTLKALKDIGEATVGEPHSRARVRGNLLRPGAFPRDLTPFEDPPPAFPQGARQAWLRAFWAWLGSFELDSLDETPRHLQSEVSR
jgi:hypothetical protein